MRGDAGFPVRLRFAKRGKVRFISHRDVARAFERAFRVAQLPLAFTAGFSPRPRVSFGLALSVGHESVAEYLDVELVRSVDPGSLPAVLADALPEGIDVTGAVSLAPRAPALQEAVSVLRYELEVTDPDGGVLAPDEVAAAVEVALARPSIEITRSRKGRSVTEDIRPALRRLAVLGSTDRGVLLDLEVSTRPAGARPREAVAAIDDGLAEGSVLRTHQWIERGGARLEPLDADRRSPAPLAERDAGPVRVPEARAS
ncbi:MAG: TIGR03936 family radical SAM-associated protein [Acidimicrobiia bacterium]|nr:TIGR03936 family radical SAM-associated protein [Acidimicrobiia bacterium]